MNGILSPALYMAESWYSQVYGVEGQLPPHNPLQEDNDDNFRDRYRERTVVVKYVVVKYIEPQK